MQVHEKRPDAVMVFIAPPSFEELASRLRGRGTEDEAKVLKRLETARANWRSRINSITSSSTTRWTARSKNCTDPRQTARLIQNTDKIYYR